MSLFVASRGIKRKHFSIRLGQVILPFVGRGIVVTSAVISEEFYRSQSHKKNLGKLDQKGQEVMINHIEKYSFNKNYEICKNNNL